MLTINIVSFEQLGPGNTFGILPLTSYPLEAVSSFFLLIFNALLKSCFLFEQDIVNRDMKRHERILNTLLVIA